MADNATLPLTGSGDSTAVVAADDVGGVLYQRVKLALGADGAAADAAVGGGVESGSLRVTIASDSTGVVSVDDNGASLTVDNAHLTSLGGAVAGTEVQVDVVAALPAGDNNIGNVDIVTVPAPLSTTGGGTEATALRVTVATDSTGVLSVDDNGGSLTVDGTVTATIAAGATTIAKAEDVASADADVGVPAMAVRKATPVNTSGTDGDYEMLQMSAGRLWTSSTVDAALPAGTNAIGKLAANSGVDIGDVDVTSVVPGTGATNLGKAEDAAHSSGDVGVMALSVRQDTAAALGGTNADYQPLITDGVGRLHVNVGTGSIADVAVVDEVTLANVGGTVAHDSADSGNPVKIGGKARTANPTAVADADRVDAMFDDIGRQVVVLSQVRDLVVHQHTQIASSSSETTILTAGASGVFHDLTQLVITNQTATAVNVTIKDATSGTTRMVIALPAAAGGGVVIPFPVPAPQASAANNWTATLSSAAVTVNFYVQAVKNV